LRLLGRLLEGDQLMAGGLVDAIRQLVGWMERSEQYNIIYNTGDEIPASSNADKDLIIFRVTQEVFNNITKHAAATQIIVDLDYAEGMLKLCISDNGVGFATDEASPGSLGMGLHNIRKRAGIIGGDATINSAPGGGTGVVISIPYP
jgi:two-component system NarL family sensor kinase